jgi:cytochrome c553
VDDSGETAKAIAPGGVLIEEGIVRRIVPGMPDKVGDEVLAWSKGQGIYQGLCSRCHGRDGADTSYSGIKPLAGIGRRLSEAEISRRIGRTGTVDLSHLSDDDRRALAMYVAGL